MNLKYFLAATIALLGLAQAKVEQKSLRVAVAVNNACCGIAPCHCCGAGGSDVYCIHGGGCVTKGKYKTPQKQVWETYNPPAGATQCV